MAKPGKRPRAEARQQVELQKYLTRWRAYEKAISNVTKWGALAFIGWISYLSVAELAGKVTNANISAVLSWPFGPGWIMVVLALLFGAGGIVYGRRQAKLRKDTIERLHEYQKRYELSIDPNRSSSRLTARGETRPEDI